MRPVVVRSFWMSTADSCSLPVTTGKLTVFPSNVSVAVFVVGSVSAGMSISNYMIRAYAMNSGAPGKLARLGVHFNALAVLDVQRHAHDQSGFKRGGLRHPAAGRIAPHARLAFDHRHLDDGREQQPDRLARVLFGLAGQTLARQLPVVR